MTVVVSVPSDSAAVALGADEVVAALVRESASRGADVRVVRTGSRGMLWLEPLFLVTRRRLDAHVRWRSRQGSDGPHGHA